MSLLPGLGGLVAATNDAALRAGVESSYLAAVDAPGDGSLLVGTSVSSLFRSAGKRGSYRLEVGAFAGSTAPLASGGRGPRGTYALRLASLATWETGPRSSCGLEGGGLLASRLAVRSTDSLAARDPFLQDRVEYAVDPGLGLSWTAGPRTSLRGAGAYVGAGGLSSAEPQAVGVDTHGARGSLAMGLELGERTRLEPQLRWSLTHFRHALLDTRFRRGEADITTASALLRLDHRLERRVDTALGAGATVATPPPILDQAAWVLTPEAQAVLTFRGDKVQAQGTYSYGYTSLGPRLGFGTRHRAGLMLSHRPLEGGAHREVRVRGLLSLSYGEAPVEVAYLTLPTAGLPPRGEGVLQSLALLGGVRLDLPLQRRLLLSTGYDLQLTRAQFDPQPLEGQPSTQLTQIVSLSLSALLSTDRAEILSLDPLGRVEEPLTAPPVEAEEPRGQGDPAAPFSAAPARTR